ncbi:MAG: hypothetical protein WC809_19270 [Sinimarinibacterium sp.]|jgi:hypothetical protein
MQKLRVILENCYGIKSLKEEFDFSAGRAAAIYAPNGAMKTSFARTFQDVAEGAKSQDRIYPKRVTARTITDEKGVELPKDNVVVLHPYNELFGSSEKVSTLLVDANLRKEYEQLLVDIEAAKDLFLKAIKEVSGSKKLGEEAISLTFTKTGEEFYTALVRVKQEVIDQIDAPYAAIQYDKVFDDKILGFLATKDVRTAIQAYIQKYDHLISASTYFKKGTFNYFNAATIAKNLAANGFFEAKHTVTLNGDEKVEITNEKELVALIQKEKDAITSDADLKKKFGEIEKLIEKNTDLRDFQAYLLEHEELLPKLENIDKFKEELLKSYFKAKSELYLDLVDRYLKTEKRKQEIEAEAGKQRTDWERTIEIFNNRFYVPFKLFPKNKVAVMLGQKPALNLGFTFDDGGDETPIEREALLKSLSTGEKKALYVLNIIFEVEVRRKALQPTVFVVDDIADSFDYKNKYAIIEYLRDISEVSHFYQIILTHNFDFFRTICSRFVSYANCRMAFKTEKGLLLDQAKGVNNVFVNDWKKEFFKDPKKKIASIPFIRNMIEYTRGEADPHYIQLTSLLHQKPDTHTLTVGDLDAAYQSVFGGTGVSAHPAKPVMDFLADAVSDCLKAGHGFNFENKIVLSIGIRLDAEKFMIAKIADNAFVAGIKSAQTGKLFGEFKNRFPKEEDTIQVLQKVILMTPESIHLNSFMYEPILDMSDDHLRKLHTVVQALK